MLSLLNEEKIVKTILDRSGIQNIEIVDTKLTNDVSCVVKGKDWFYIGIDLDRIGSAAELRCAIYHELGHIATNSFYSSETPEEEKRKAERLAVRWAITHCVTFEELVASLRNGVTNVYELAEYFDLTIASAEKILSYYRERVCAYMHLFFGENYEETA